MICSKCGKNIKKEAKFCPYCGTSLDEGTNYIKVDRTKGKKKIVKWIISISTIFIVAILIALFIATKKKEIKENNNYQELIEKGNHYLVELDYKNAEAHYLQAIEIEPKKVEAYEKLVEIYEIQDEKEKILDILEEAVLNVDEEQVSKFQNQYDLYIYVDEVLIPKNGECKEGEYECSYFEQGTKTFVDSLHTENGVMSWKIMDYDQDDKKELLVLSLKNQETNMVYDNMEMLTNAVYLQMYESKNGEVLLTDEYKALCPVLGVGTFEDDGIFLQEEDDHIYICGSNYATLYNNEDEIIIKSFILTYENEKFARQAGLLEAKIGTDFSGMQQTNQYKKMIETLNEIGLNNDVEEIKETSRMIFDFGNKQEKMLLRIQGKNTKLRIIYGNKEQGEFLPEEQEKGISLEEQEADYIEIIGEKIAEHYKEIWKPQGKYVAIIEKDSSEEYKFELRYQKSEEEARQQIEAGGFPEANILVATVVVNKKTGEVRIDGTDELWNLDLPY